MAKDTRVRVFVCACVSVSVCVVRVFAVTTMHSQTWLSQTIGPSTWKSRRNEGKQRQSKWA